MTPFICFHEKENLELVCLLCFVKKNMSKYSLLSVFITNVAVVAILTASISSAHPGSPPPDRTASGQRFATAAFLVSLHGLWPDIRVCTLSGQLFWGWQPRLQTAQTTCQTTMTTCCAMRRLATFLTTQTRDLI